MLINYFAIKIYFYIYQYIYHYFPNITLSNFAIYAKTISQTNLYEFCVCVLSYFFFKTSFIITFWSTDGPDVWIKLFY